MLKIPIMKSYPKIKLNLKVESFYANSQQYGNSCIFFAKFLVSAFYLAVIFQLREYQVLVFICLSNIVICVITCRTLQGFSKRSLANLIAFAVLKMFNNLVSMQKCLFASWSQQNYEKCPIGPNLYFYWTFRNI